MKTTSYRSTYGQGAQALSIQKICPMSVSLAVATVIFFKGILLHENWHSRGELLLKNVLYNR